MKPLIVESPIKQDILQTLATGTRVSISGTIYTARDAAHRILFTALENGQTLPFELAGQTLYYMGPSPARPGQVIGSAGPTTSGRIDIYTPRLLEAGIRAMIGKGKRSAPVIEAMNKYGAVYFVTIGGAGALLAQSIKKADTIAYPELGPEAILRLEVADFPAIVAIDTQGTDIYEVNRAPYHKGGK